MKINTFSNPKKSLEMLEKSLNELPTKVAEVIVNPPLCGFLIYYENTITFIGWFVKKDKAYKTATALFKKHGLQVSKVKTQTIKQAFCLL